MDPGKSYEESIHTKTKQEIERRLHMKIVCLFGSSRIKGNSAFMAERFLSRAESKGAQVKRYRLNTLTYRGCQSCYACKKKSEECVLRDDLQEVLRAVRDCDVLVMATPVFYGEVSGQLKCFIDRTFSYLGPDYTTNPAPSRLVPGKTLVFIVSQGDPDVNAFSDIFPRYDFFFRWYGFTESYCVRACGVLEAESVSSRDDVLQKIDETAESVMRTRG